MTEHIIPVAFSVVSDDLDEAAAAEWLARFLQVAADVYGANPNATPQPPPGSISEWWMPNNPAADHSDNDAHLVWIYPEREDYETCRSHSDRQLMADTAIEDFYKVVKPKYR